MTDLVQSVDRHFGRVFSFSPLPRLETRLRADFGMGGVSFGKATLRKNDGERHKPIASERSDHVFG